MKVVISRRSLFCPNGFIWNGSPFRFPVSTIVDSACPGWSPPPHGWIKVNIDASLSLQRDSVGFGCVIRNDDGSFVAAKVGSFYSQMDAKCAETMAFREVLVISVNCVLLDDLSYFGLLIQDCKLLLSSYEKAKCVFVYRSANDIAHILAISAHSKSS
ncbi:hypothetical protein MANES_09G121201v8 [Manihot esculenta]|uniref:Uncharacterized protein n=1 Tax=Manihot esculenta TaxID=3983 RepID=A0ACB7H6S0_MANES|nr:hypothetical protein MANES_09G121201v8 [Manihot esculenta]